MQTALKQSPSLPIGLTPPGWACEGSCDKAPATDNKPSVACPTSDCGKCSDAQAAAKGAKECLVFDDMLLLFDMDKFEGYSRIETARAAIRGLAMSVARESEKGPQL